MSLLTFSLARFRVGEEDWQYVAVLGALIYFHHNQLYLNTRHYVRGGDYEAVRATLRTQFIAEERELHDVKTSLQRLEEQMLKKLVEMNRGTSA